MLCRHEPAVHLWRYLLLLEWTDALNARPEPRTGGGGLFVCAPGHLGDLLHTIPMLRAVRRQRPDWRITLLVGPWCEGLARGIPYVNEVVVWAPRFVQYGREYLRAMPGPSEEKRLVRELRRRQPDILITTVGTDPAILFLALGVRPRTWIGVGSHPAGYETLDDERVFEYDTRQHEAERIMALAAPLGVEPGDASLEFPLTASDEAAADELLRDQGMGEHDVFAVMAPGAGWPGKIWPAERFGEVARWLWDSLDMRVVLLGAPGEEKIARVVATHVPMRGGGGEARGWGHPRLHRGVATHVPMRGEAANRADEDIRGYTTGIVDLVGKAPIGVSAAVIKRARLWIGNDNALLHVAAAFGVPTVALFGPTRPEKWAPRGAQHVALKKMEACHGCYPWHPSARCVEDGRCMKAIAVSEVKEAVPIAMKTALAEKT